MLRCVVLRVARRVVVIAGVRWDSFAHGNRLSAHERLRASVMQHSAEINRVGLINEVNRRRSRLKLRWVTI